MFCRQKRIVKRTHTDGSTEYVGQTKSLFGWEDGEGKLLSSGYQPRDTGSTYSQSKPSPSFITEELIEKYREL